MLFSQPVSSNKVAGADFDALVDDAVRELRTTSTHTWATSTAHRIIRLVVRSIESRLDEPARLRSTRATSANSARSATVNAMNLILASAVQTVTAPEFRAGMVSWAEEDVDSDGGDEYADEDEHSGFLSRVDSGSAGSLSAVDVEKRVKEMIETTFKTIHAATNPAALPGVPREAKQVGCHFVRKAIEEEARLAGVRL